MDSPSPYTLFAKQSEAPPSDSDPNAWPTPSPLGRVYLIGAGPGAKDLITIRGAQLLAQADIVFYDALIEPEMLEYCPQAKRVEVGKRCGRHSSVQSFINKRLVDAAKKYRCVVRLKGGDPMIFGRAQEELEALRQAGIEAQVVPGISAALAAAASLQQSLTVRGLSRSVAFCTLAQAQGESDPAPVQADTLALYMGRKHAQSFASKLLASGKASHTPVLAITGVSTVREHHWASTLGEVAKHGFADLIEGEDAILILVGEVFADSAKNAIPKLESQTLFVPQMHEPPVPFSRAI